MSDIYPSSQFPVKITDNTNTVAITAASALKVDSSHVTQPVSGTLTQVPSGTQIVSGTVTNVPSGTQVVSGTVISTGTLTTVPSGTQTVGGTVTAVPAGTQVVSGTVAVSGTVPVSGTVAVSNLGSITTIPSGTQTVAGTVTAVQSDYTQLRATVVGSGVAGGPATGVLTVQGITSMTPLLVNGSGVTQPVSGTVTAVPTGSQTIIPSGTQTVTGTVTNVPSGTQIVSGTVTTVGNATVTLSEVTTGAVINYSAVAAVAALSTGIVSYTVTTGKTLFIKGVLASSSGAPCKVAVDIAGTQTLAVGFYSAANPFLSIPFYQPAVANAGQVVNIRILNNAGSAQDVYATLMGREV